MPSAALGCQPCPWSTHLDEVPPLVQAALDLVAVKQLGQPTLGVVYQAAGVREERGGPQGSQVQKAFLGVAGQLGRESRVAGEEGQEGRGETMKENRVEIYRFHPSLCSRCSCGHWVRPVTHPHSQLTGEPWPGSPPVC